jgi:hypothetical protein
MPQLPGQIVVNYPIQAPNGTTEVNIYGDDPLILSQQTSPDDEAYVITNGKTFCVQEITIGCEGDPSADGSKVEVIFDNNGTERVIDRLYVMGISRTKVYPDLSKSRDGTTLAGNAGGTNKIILRRVRLSNASQEVDAVLRGYEI